MENVFGILASRFMVLLGTMEPKIKGCQRHCFEIVFHNIQRTHQGGPDRAPTPADDIAALQTGQVVYVPDENYRNPSNDAKHLQDLLKDYFNHVGALAQQEDRI